MPASIGTGSDSQYRPMPICPNISCMGINTLRCHSMNLQVRQCRCQSESLAYLLRVKRDTAQLIVDKFAMSMGSRTFVSVGTGGKSSQAQACFLRCDIPSKPDRL